MKKLTFEDYTVEYDDSLEMKSKVFDRLMEYFIKHEAFAGEVIAQNDNCLIDASQVLIDIADDVIKFDETYKD